MKKLILTIVFFICALAQLQSANLIIKSNITTNTTYYLSKFTTITITANVHITNNSTLTLTAEPVSGYTTNPWVLMSNVTIYIEPGSSLILNGAKLTPNGDFYWPGIVVEGNSNDDQRIYPFNYRTQGYLLLKNGAMIDRAVLGIHVLGGGVVQSSCVSPYANPSTGYYPNTIQNCNNSVRFEPYTNPVTSKSKTNKSWFTHTNFKYDTYHSPGFQTFVAIEGIQGISFYGCIFEVTQSPNVYTGIGIGALNSSFSVQKSSLPNPNPVVYQAGSCVPSPNGYSNYFLNLGIGILSYYSSTVDGRKTQINDNYFNNNSIGIELNNDEYSIIYKNNFNYSTNIPVLQNKPNVCGIYTTYCKSPKIYENTFYWGISTTTQHYYGIYNVYPNYQYTYRIKKNFFNNNTTNKRDYFHGTYLSIQDGHKADVKYVCNGFSSLYEAFKIEENTNSPNGITMQYDPDAMPYITDAGNRFFSDKYIFNYTGYSNPNLVPKINYACYTKDNIHLPYPDLPNNSIINLIYTGTYANSCPNISTCEIYGKAGTLDITLAQRSSNYEVSETHFLIRGVEIDEVIQTEDTTVTITVYDDDQFLEDYMDYQIPVVIEDPEITEMNTTPPEMPVHFDLTPNPSNTDISIDVSEEIKYYDDYAVNIYDDNQNLKYYYSYSNQDTIITILRSLIGYNGIYHCQISLNSEVDTTINFELTDIIHVTVYPNPISYGNLNISLTGIDNYEHYTVRIYDAYNDLKYEHEYNGQDNPIEISSSYIDVPGTYTVAIIVNNQIVYATFVFVIYD